MRLSRCLADLFLALVVVTAPGAAPREVPSPATPAKPAVVAPPLPGGPAPDLDLVFTGQVAGYVEPCG